MGRFRYVLQGSLQFQERNMMQAAITPSLLRLLLPTRHLSFNPPFRQPSINPPIRQPSINISNVFFQNKYSSDRVKFKEERGD